MTDPTEEMLCLQDFDESIANIYRVANPKAPWGDYGAILVHGMTSHTPDAPRPPELQRTGPFVPPISLPGYGYIIITEAVRHELESSGLTGFSFIPAIKKVIVPIDWQNWDFSKEPPFYPEEGEPENYITEDKHSPELARRMPNLWRLVISPGATEIRVPEGVHYTGDGGQIFIRASSWNGADFFRADTTLQNYVSPRARQWLLDRHPAWIAFEPVQTR
jgi:hypothetical protein